MNSFLLNLLIVVGQVSTLFLLMSVGFILAKLGRLTSAALPQISSLLLYIVTPCIIIDTLQVESDPTILADLLASFVLVLLIYLLIGLLSQLFFRKEERDTRDTLRFSGLFGNTGFMGLPLIAAILGRENLIFSMPSFLCFQLVAWSYGAYLMGGKGEFSLRKALVNPATVGVAVGIFLFLTGTMLPSTIGSTITFLADLNTPLAMIIIGAQMAATNLPSTFRNAKLYQSAGIKLLLGPLITAVLLLPFQFTPLVYVTAVILAGTPTAGITGMFAEQFNRDTESAAQSITLSTLLSILTLPVVAVAAMGIAGM